MHDNPWQTESSQEVYRNPWIRVIEHQVIRPDGQAGIYGVVSAKLATGVLALTDDDEVVLVGQWRYALDAYSWELPEGGADPGEDGLAAIKRELREEAGYVADTWERLGPPVHLSNSHSDEVGELFRARGLRQVGAAPDPDERITVARIPFDEVARMVADGAVTDSLTVVAVLREQVARLTPTRATS